MDIRFYSIANAFIARLRLVDHRVLSNHEEKRKHLRPYVGFIVKVNNYDYFLPLSSSDPKDYDENKRLRPSTQTILRMKNKKDEYLGKILLNNMIPAPNSEISEISLSKKPLTGRKEEDVLIEIENKYKDLMIDELNRIKENIREITSKTKRLYSAKVNESNEIYWKGRKKPNYLKATVDFRKIEEAVRKDYTL